MKKTKRKILSVTLVLCMLVSVFGVYTYADGEFETRHVFTKAELAGLVSPSGSVFDAGGFVDVELIEGQVPGTRTIEDYYVIKQENGDLLADSSGSLSVSRFSSGNDNYHVYQKWTFMGLNDNTYNIYPYSDGTKTIAVNPADNSVYLTGSPSLYNKWVMEFNSGGANALKLVAPGTSLNGYRLVIDAYGNLSVSNTAYTPVGFYDIYWYVPSTALYADYVSLTVDAGGSSSQYISPVYTPSDATVTFPKMTECTPSSGTFYSINASGRVTVTDAGHQSITLRDKITDVYCNFSILGTRLPNPNGQNKSNWCWAAAAKMVGEHNGGSGALNTGASRLAHEDGLYSYVPLGSIIPIPFYGEDSYFGKWADAGQRQIVLNVKGTDADVGATSTTEVESALQLASYNTMNVGTLGASNGTGLNSSEISAMKSDLANGLWIVGIITDGNIDHAIVITSYISQIDTYLFWDPATGNHGYGFSGTELANGTITLPLANGYFSLLFVQYCR